MEDTYRHITIRHHASTIDEARSKCFAELAASLPESQTANTIIREFGDTVATVSHITPRTYAAVIKISYKDIK